MDRLASLFNEIRNTYFPCWDVRNEWRIETANQVSESALGYADVCGFCDSPTKTVGVLPGYVEESDDRLRCLIIHEICHAVGGPGHGKRWQLRFEKAAAKAHTLGESRLSEMIHSEVKTYRDSPVLTARDVYGKIADALTEAPDASSDAVLDWVAGNFGLTLPGLLKRYPRAKDTFRKAQREAQRMRTAQARVRALLDATASRENEKGGNMKRKANQTEIAKRLGISKSYLSMMLSGQRPCPPEVRKLFSSQGAVNNSEARLCLEGRNSTTELLPLDRNLTAEHL